jgi:hypothetical protein
MANAGWRDGGNDQATLPVFRILLLVQVVAAALFGLIPYFLPGAFAAIAGYPGREDFVYRLAGAATTGYVVTAILILRQPGWHAARIPIVATFTFTAAAAGGSLVTLIEGDRRWIVWFVFVAATAFALLAAYWLVRDPSERRLAGLSGRRMFSALPDWFRLVLGLATLSALVFGLAPLIIPRTFASLVGLGGTETWVYRMAGAATFGYATAGVLEIRAQDRSAIAVQNLGAITFNALGAIAAAFATFSGHGAILGPLVLLAAGFFTVALALGAARTPRD